MSRANFCKNCGVRLPRNTWRERLRRSLCADCAMRLGMNSAAKSVAVVSLIALSAFAFGRYLRPKPPPLLIERAANSPLSDLPIDVNTMAQRNNASPNQNRSASLANSVDDAVYICGARTKKGTPCRRRVHAAGDRCFQHKGMPAMVALEKLTIKPDTAKK